jgi:hypothetical protein
MSFATTAQKDLEEIESVLRANGWPVPWEDE